MKTKLILVTLLVVGLVCVAVEIAIITTPKMTYDDQIRLIKEGKLERITTSVQEAMDNLPRIEHIKTGEMPQTYTELMEMLRRGEEPIHHAKAAS